ncbi:hypothetical protein EVAR_14482_1 [Eumeta japonica]|uniref:Uncharacterized protein n=1 Tax=Eumeta variegata TaxID=151549 RepID=A0A4C1U4K2_EUMVA|nr:hypothetical protein EVAR_14482_1 [Eumeta japonica]
MPPSRIKLESMKQFVKKLDETLEASGYLKNFFTKLSEAKVRTGVFAGKPIRQIFVNEKFSTLLNLTQKASGNSFKAVVSGFLGNNEAKYYKKLVEDMPKKFKATSKAQCCRMSLKVHTLRARLDKYKNNMGAYAEKQGERFTDGHYELEQLRQSQYNENMIVSLQPADKSRQLRTAAQTQRC